MPLPFDTTITLTVVTSGIIETNKNEKVTFSDDQGDTAEVPGQPGTYLSSVNKNAKVIWKGKPSIGSATINITSVSQKDTDGGSKIIKTFGTKKSKDGKPYTVTAQVKNKNVTGNESYQVSFSIVNGTSTKSFTIDPLLKMKN